MRSNRPHWKFILVWISVIICNVARLSAADSANQQPRQILRQAVTAISAEDEAALDRILIFSGRDDEAAWQHAMIHMLIARQRLDRLSIAKFGKTLPAADAVQPHLYFSPEMLRKISEVVEKASVTMDKTTPPESARITIDLARTGLGEKPASKATTQSAPSDVVLRTVKGEWKIDLSSIIAFPPPDPRRHQDAKQQEFFLAIFSRQIRSWKEAADGIEAGRLKTLDEADAAASRG